MVMLVLRVARGTSLAPLFPRATSTRVFCIGLSLLLSALSVFFRDVMHLWGVVTIAWTYATPLFYPFEILPEWLQALERFNPMYLYVTFIRDCCCTSACPRRRLTAGLPRVRAVSLAIGYPGLPQERAQVHPLHLGSDLVTDSQRRNPIVAAVVATWRRTSVSFEAALTFLDVDRGRAPARALSLPLDIVVAALGRATGTPRTDAASASCRRPGTFIVTVEAHRIMASCEQASGSA